MEHEIIIYSLAIEVFVNHVCAPSIQAKKTFWSNQSNVKTSFEVFEASPCLWINIYFRYGNLPGVTLLT